MALKLPNDPFGPRYAGHGAKDEIAEARARRAAYASAGQLEMLFAHSPTDRPPGWEPKEAVMTLPKQSPRKPVMEVVQTMYGPVEIEVKPRGHGGGRGGRGGR